MDGIVISAVRWQDNRCYLVINLCGLRACKWGDSLEQQSENPRESVLPKYRQCLQQAHGRSRSHRFTNRIVQGKNTLTKVVPSSFFHLLHMTVINSWLLYRQLLSTSPGQVQSESISLQQNWQISWRYFKYSWHSWRTWYVRAAAHILCCVFRMYTSYTRWNVWHSFCQNRSGSPNQTGWHSC